MRGKGQLFLPETARVMQLDDHNFNTKVWINSLLAQAATPVTPAAVDVLQETDPDTEGE